MSKDNPIFMWLVWTTAAVAAAIPPLLGHGNGPRSFPLVVRILLGALAFLLIATGGLFASRLRQREDDLISFFLKRGVFGYLFAGLSIPLAFLSDAMGYLVTGMAMLIIANVIFLVNRSSLKPTGN